LNNLKAAFQKVGQEMRKLGQDFRAKPSVVRDRPVPRPQDIEDLGPIEAEPLSDITRRNIRREHQRQVQMTETVTNAHRTPDPNYDGPPRVILPGYRGPITSAPESAEAASSRANRMSDALSRGRVQ
jgi:hypothetical protein